MTPIAFIGGPWPRRAEMAPVKRISRTVAGWLAGVTPSGHQRKMSFALKSTPNAGSTRRSHWGVSHFSGPMSLGAQRALMLDMSVRLPAHYGRHTPPPIPPGL